MNNVNTTGWEGVFHNYPKSNLKHSCSKTIIIASASTILVCLLMDLTETLKVTVDFIINTVPTILGFTLAALALFFSVAINFDHLFWRKEEGKSSLFQEVQATFGIIILVMVVTLAVSFLVKLCLKQTVQMPIEMAIEINTLALFLVLFLLFYTLFSILDVTINLLNLGQYIQSVQDRKKSDEFDKSSSAGTD